MAIAGPSGTLPAHGPSFVERCAGRADRSVARRRLGRADRTTVWVADRFPGPGILGEPLGLLVFATIREPVRGLLQNLMPPPNAGDAVRPVRPGRNDYYRGPSSRNRLSRQAGRCCRVKVLLE